MTERFWAPQRPTETPDAVALALLSPHGGDAAADLGASLLGMHRAGAAACEAVAKGAVPSEKRLLEALARCRQALGGPAVDAVSKSMEATYAGLLVRDLLDDADRSALSVFRTCVSKGVAPPLAASRAGAVYGVPSSALGKYTALAADPRVNPVALTDAADRALLGYVSKVVEAEAGEVKEEVSKSPTGHARELGGTDEGWEEREHPRDRTTGRFVHAPPRTGPPVKEEPQRPTPPAMLSPADQLRQRLGLLETPPAIVVEPEPAPPAPTTTPTRRGRVQRVQRTQRTQRTSRAPQGRLVPTGETQLRSSTQTRPSTQVGSRAALSEKVKASLATTAELRRELGMATTTAEMTQKSKDLIIPSDRSRLPHDDLMEKPAPYSSSAEYEEMYEPLIFTMGEAEGLELRVRAKGSGLSDDPLRLRAGYMVEAAGQAESNVPSDDGKPTPADNIADHLAKIIRERTVESGTGTPIIRQLDPRMMNDPRRRSEYVRGQMADLAAQSPLVHSDEDLEDEMTYIEVLTDSETGNEVLVHFQPVRDPDDEVRYPHRRPQPVLDQYVLQGMAFRGRFEGTARHPQYLIDPNQALAIAPEFDQLWDSKRQVIIHRYQIRPLSEAEVDTYDENSKWEPGSTFFKALDRSEAMVFEQQHPRDAEGKFAPKAQARSGVAPTAMPTPVEQLRTQYGLEETQVSAPARPKAKPTQRTGRVQRVQRTARVSRSKMRPITTTGATAVRPQTELVRPTLGSKVTTSRRAALRNEARLARLGVNVNRGIVERAEALDDLPVMDHVSDYQVLTKGDWSTITEAISDEAADILEEKNGMIPFRGLFRNRVLDATGRTKYGQAQQQLINNAADDLFSNEYDIVEKPLGKPFLLGESVDEEKALGHHIADAFDEHPEIDQITVIENPETHYVQLYGNARPVAKQYLLEIEPNIDLTADNLQIMNVGEYRTKNVTIDFAGTMHPIVPVDADVHGVGALNLPVQIFRVIAPKVGYRRVVED